MGTFINTGNYGVWETGNGKYVDKSGIIAFVNSRLRTEDNFFCVTRMRRSGKTVSAKMLVGINYDKTTKVHECTIETIECQQ